MISISSQGICGEDDSGFPGLKKARFPARIRGASRFKRVDMLWISWRGHLWRGHYYLAFRSSIPWFNLSPTQPSGISPGLVVALFEAQLIKAKSTNIRQATNNAVFMEKPSIFSHSLDGCALGDGGSVCAPSYWPLWLCLEPAKPSVNSSIVVIMRQPWLPQSKMVWEPFIRASQWSVPAYNAFASFLCLPSIHHSNLTCKSVFGGQVTPYCFTVY